MVDAVARGYSQKSDILQPQEGVAYRSWHVILRLAQRAERTLNCNEGLTRPRKHGGPRGEVPRPPVLPL